MIRWSFIAPSILLTLSVGVKAEEYKQAVVAKPPGLKNEVELTVKGGEHVTLAISILKSRFYDDQGNELKGPDRQRVFRVGNVVDVVSSHQNKREFLDEIRLVQGELAPAGGGAAAKQKPGFGDRPIRSGIIINTGPREQKGEFPRYMWDEGIKDYKVGDFVEHQMVGGSISRREVVEVGDHYFIDKVTTTLPGGGSTDHRFKYIYTQTVDKKSSTQLQDQIKRAMKNAPASATSSDKETEVTVELPDGKKVKGKLVESYLGGVPHGKAWFAPSEVPFEGLVRRENSAGKGMAQLISYGKGK
jgi:hypothetical protein